MQMNSTFFSFMQMKIEYLGHYLIYQDFQKNGVCYFTMSKNIDYSSFLSYAYPKKGKYNMILDQK